MKQAPEATWEPVRQRLLARVTDAHLAVLRAEEELDRRRHARTVLVREVTERFPISLREIARHLDLAPPSVTAWVRELNAKEEAEHD